MRLRTLIHVSNLTSRERNIKLVVSCLAYLQKQVVPQFIDRSSRKA